MKLYVLTGYYNQCDMVTLIGVFDSMEKVELAKTDFLDNYQIDRKELWNLYVDEFNLNEISYEIDDETRAEHEEWLKEQEEKKKRFEEFKRKWNV